MNAAGVRVYLADEERDKLEQLVRTHGSSRSFVMRVALRLLVGMPVPPGFERPRALNVTDSQGYTVPAGTNPRPAGSDAPAR